MLPTKSPPTDDQIRQWINYAERKIPARRFALRAMVYSNNAIKKSVHFSLRKYDVALHPVEKTAEVVFGDKHRFMPAYTCELISKEGAGSGQIGAIFDLQAALDSILPLMGFDYELTLDFEMWEDYGEGWLPVQAFGGYGKYQHGHGDVPNPRIHELVAAYEILSTREDAQSKKFFKLRQKLKEAASQANVSPRYGLLAYYNVIEVVADELIGPSESGKPYPQKVKMQKLLALHYHNFNPDECIKVADTRNKLAHSDQPNVHIEALLCRDIALWAAELIALKLVSFPPNLRLSRPSEPRHHRQYRLSNEHSQATRKPSSTPTRSVDTP